MKTEQIAGSKLVTTPKGEQVLVTTASNNTIWVKKEQFDATADTITYNARLAGEAYTNTKTGVTGTVTKPFNEFVGCGRHSKADNAIRVFQELQKLGITPAINM